MYCYNFKTGYSEVADWIVNQNGGPKKYFDGNPCITEWWHEKDKSQLNKTVVFGGERRGSKSAFKSPPRKKQGELW